MSDNSKGSICSASPGAARARQWNDLANMRRRVNRARNFPANTCPASRHVHIMADCLASGRGYPMFIEEPEHCARSLYAVLESLWKLRTKVDRLERMASGDAGQMEPSGSAQVEPPK